jgi:hypothetical protein
MARSEVQRLKNLSHPTTAELLNIRAYETGISETEAVVHARRELDIELGKPDAKRDKHLIAALRRQIAKYNSFSGQQGSGGHQTQPQQLDFSGVPIGGRGLGLGRGVGQGLGRVAGPVAGLGRGAVGLGDRGVENQLQNLYHLVRRNQRRGTGTPGTNIITVPGAGGVQSGRTREKGGTKIIQKVKVVQHTTSSKKTGAATTKKLYSKLRKQLIALFKKSRRDAYNTRNATIKKRPAKIRSTERKTVKEQLKAKLDKLLRLLPSAAKLKKSEVQKMYSRAKTLKW